MEIEIKKAVKAGNSSAVILPRAWLNREVRVELVKKNPKEILFDVIDIAKRYIFNLEEIIGIYLVGSYARKEEGRNSDIDILVITNNIDKEMIKEGIYSILIVSKDLVEQKLKYDLFPIGSMIKEAKPLINRAYLSSLKVRVSKENVRWYIDTTKEKLDLIREILDKKRDVENRVVYTLVLRVRTLHIIQKMIRNKPYYKKDFISLIN